MDREDKRLSMGLDEIIRMQDLNNTNGTTSTDGNTTGANVENGNSTLHIKTNSVAYHPNHSQTNHKNNYSRRGVGNVYNRHSYSYEYDCDNRCNSYHRGRSHYWHGTYNRRFRPYRGRPSHSHGYYYNRHNHRRLGYHSGENNYSNDLTEEKLMKFNMLENGYNPRNWRSGSVNSNRSYKSNRSNYSNRSNQSKRSFHSQRSFRSDRSDRSFGSNRSFNSFRSFNSNHSFGSNRSFGSNHSFGSNRSHCSNGPRRPWMNYRFHSFKRHKNILDHGIQEEIRKIQEDPQRSNSVLLRSLDLDFKPIPTSTCISLTERFRLY